MLSPRGPLRLDHLPGGEVRAPDVADLALLHEVIKRPQRFLNGSRHIRKMDLIEVDPVGPEAAEAVFDCVEDVPARGAPVQRSLSDRPDEFRRDDHVLAPVSECRAEKLLAARAAVDVRRIEQRYP